MKKLLNILITPVFVGLVACGGGGGDPGSQPGVTPGAKNVARITYQLDKNALGNFGTEEAVLTVTALDSDNNPVKDAALKVSVDSGIYTPVTAVSDASGSASGRISSGTNKANRDIKATIQMGGQSAVAVIPVTGSQIALSLIPGTPVPGGAVDLSIKVTDVNGNGIPGVPVTLAGTLGFSGSPTTTDRGGNASARIAAAPSTAGTYSVEATASGVTTRQDVAVLNPGGAGIPDAIGIISAASLAIAPDTISPNSPGSTVSRAGLRAVFQNSQNQAIQNVRARFEIVPPGLGSDEKISTGTAVVYSDSNGQALAEYIAGTRASPTDGVVIRVCYGASDADVANGACTNSRVATMTVASQPLSITLGDNNELVRGANNLTYIKKFDIAVSDSAGLAVSNAEISASVDLIEFEKGPYLGPRFSCLNEDINRNGFLDQGEDTDGNGVISPRKADVLLSYVGEKKTGINGRVNIQVEYPMNVATWLHYVVKVTTKVSGSEGRVEKRYRTEFIEGDDKNGSFLTPPYGVNDCSTAN